MRNRALLILVLMAAPAAFAGRKEDLQKQAQAAAAARRLDEAANAMCELAKLDSAKKPDCEVAKSEAAAEERRNETRFNDGVSFFNQGQFDDAEQKFKNIRFGTHFTASQRYLTQTIPAKRREQQAAAAEAPQLQLYNDGLQAYNSNNFGAAKSSLSRVQGSKAGEAQALLSKINQYESAMAEGDRLAASGNYRQAQQSYEDAARLKGDGPGDPRGKATRAQAAAAAPAGTTTTAGTRTTPTPTPTTTTAVTRTTPVVPVSRTGAIKEPARPKIDIEKLLREAADAHAKKNNAAAKSKYIAVLGEEPNNRTARAALDQILQEEQAKPEPAQQQVVATSEADVMLLRAIGEYYKGSYNEAETHIKDYQNVNGSKKALGYFFSGVSKLTRYYLGGGTDRKLYNDAEAALRIAKSTQGFKPPDEQYVSPKILKVYNSL
jgi:outer membrane protein assembly factor BamD (BamD/ComL family)